MTPNNLKQRAKSKFVVTPEEVLEEHLDRMEGWFSFADGEIHLSADVTKLPQAPAYLCYLLAAYVADFVEVRDSPAVSHDEANQYFGWAKGATAKHQASEHAKLLLNREDGKCIATGQLGSAIDIVAERLD